MNCRSLETLIQKSLDEGLTPSERAKADGHLSTCPACRAAWDEHHRLARLAGRWVHRVEGTEASGDVFTRQVLDRIAAQPAPVPSRPDYWRPLAALGALMLALAFLPHPVWLGLPDFISPARALPDWALALGRALPGDAASIWRAGQSALTLPAWLWSALPAAGLLNGICYALSRRRSLS